jgi:hypothetical protein
MFNNDTAPEKSETQKQELHKSPAYFMNHFLKSIPKVEMLHHKKKNMNKNQYKQNYLFVCLALF